MDISNLVVSCVLLCTLTVTLKRGTGLLSRQKHRSRCFTSAFIGKSTCFDLTDWSATMILCPISYVNDIMNKVFFNWITFCTQTFEDMPRILPKSIYKQLQICFLSTLHIAGLLSNLNDFILFSFYTAFRGFQVHFMFWLRAGKAMLCSLFWK